MNSFELTSLNDKELMRQFKIAITEERRATIEVLKYFRECERRMLYAEFGYSSLLDFAVRELGFSEPAAYRRISAMRAIKEVPEAEEKIHSGELNLTTISQAQSFFRKNRKAGRKFDSCEKREVLNSLTGLSSRSAELALMKINPELFRSASEMLRALPDGGTQVSTSLKAETALNLNEIQDLLGRSMSFSELIAYLAEEQVQLLRKKKGVRAADIEVQPSLRNAKPAAVSQDSMKYATYAKRKYLSRNLERLIWQRAKGCCEWKHPLTNTRCEQRRYLQVEHIRPVAHGGGDEIENLQLLCSTHNKLRAVKVFGRDKMQRFVPSLR